MLYGKERLTVEKLVNLASNLGDSFYLLDTNIFEQNYRDLEAAFKKYYQHFKIAYSYKTNYTPALVKIVDKLGGYAEVVSDMELDVALKVGVKPEKIIWNGPVKNEARVEELLLAGGTVNIDSIYELDNLQRILDAYPEHILNIGVRCNYDVGDGVLSRFGFDVEGEDFDQTLKFIATRPNIHFVGLQAHFAKRAPEYWTARAKGMLDVYDWIVNKYGLKAEHLDIGGGIYGNMPDSLRSQLGINDITYDDYASRAASVFAECFSSADSDVPTMLIEPGSALAGDCMRFVCRVKTIKSIRGKTIATIAGSQKNISMNGLNPPMEVVHCGANQGVYTDTDIVGFTCIEGDILQKNYSGPLAIGDFIIISNCGSYSVVMKPPFILPNVPIIDTQSWQVVKQSEAFNDLFSTFVFDLPCTI